MKYVFRELNRHRWRTAAGITGYAIAVFFIFTLLSLSSASKNHSFGILQGTGTHFIMYVPAGSACCSSQNEGGSLIAEGVNTQMLDFAILDSVKHMEGIRDAAPYILYSMYNEQFRTEISIGGVDTSSLATKNNVCEVTNLITGKFLSFNPNEIVAEQSFVLAHNLSLGDSLDIFGGRMILAGIINSGIKPGKADFYAPIEIVRNILKEKLHCNSQGYDLNVILVEVADSRVQKSLLGRLNQTMKKYAVSSYNCYEPASAVMGIIDKSTGSLAIIVFIFLVIFSAKTQHNSLMERYREIGILKSLGWSDPRLAMQILMVSLVQALAGVLAGLGLGYLTILLLNHYQLHPFHTFNFQFQAGLVPDMIMLAIGGALFACIPSLWKITRSKAGEMINNFL